jgi:hypothetical protein
MIVFILVSVVLVVICIGFSIGNIVLDIKRSRQYGKNLSSKNLFYKLIALFFLSELPK